MTQEACVLCVAVFTQALDIKTARKRERETVKGVKNENTQDREPGRKEKKRERSVGERERRRRLLRHTQAKLLQNFRSTAKQRRRTRDAVAVQCVSYVYA